MEYKVLSYNRDKTGKHITYHIKKENIANSLKLPSGNQQQYVLVTPRSTNTQQQSMNTSLEGTKTMETQQQLFPKNSQTSTCSSEDSPAKRLASQVKDLDLTTPEGLCSLKSLGFSRLKDQSTLSWKTSKGFFLTTPEELSKPSSPRLLSWGMVSNGKCLTARITECRRTGKECSLSDILEEKVAEKYFLSERLCKSLMTDKIFKAMKPQGGADVSKTLTARYWKMGKTDPYIKSEQMENNNATECMQRQG